jgi:predicted nucleotidyltransferase
MNHQTNIASIRSISTALDSLNKKVVFVGGATISLYPDRITADFRPTEDVDVIIEILNYSARIELEEKLREIGFLNDIKSGIVCRYQYQNIVVDIMPTNDPSIGFTNLWYPDGYTHAIEYLIDERTNINILSPPYFIATKLEAFKGRGKNDGRTSKDFEDIVYVLENRSSIWMEMNSCEINLKEYLKREFQDLIKNQNLFEWIDGHVERASPPATYQIMEQIEIFIK